MTDSILSYDAHGLSGLSLIQLEGALVAANLLLEAWRMPLPEFEQSCEGSHSTEVPHDDSN